MVGDSPEDDIEGARALGMRAFLVDRDDRFPEVDGPSPRPARAAGRARPLIVGLAGSRDPVRLAGAEARHLPQALRCEVDREDVVVDPEPRAGDTPFRRVDHVG